MTFDPARPRYTLPLAGQDYDLLGTMEVIENIEYQLKKPIGRVAVEAVNELPAYELAVLIAAILSKCGHKMTVTEAKDLIWSQVGLSGDANAKLRLHLYAFISICIAPPEAREARAKEMGELHGELESISASLGESTKKPASDASNGSRRSSGKPRHGT